MCCHPGFVVSFIEHRQKRFRIIFGSLGFSKWSMSNGFNFKSPAALDPNRRVSLSFEDLKPGR